MHALQVISEQGMKPLEKAQDAKVQGHIIAHAIFAQFATEGEQGKTRMALVRQMAEGDSRLTWDQLEAELSAAIKLANEADELAGWKAPADAKGAAKYGPKRASLNTNASCIRTIWGAIVHCNATATQTSDGQPCKPVITPEMGFNQAVAQARATLKAHGVKPDGSRVLSDVEKAGVKAAHMEADAKAAWIKANPQRAGETIEEYAARRDQGMGDILAASIEAEDKAKVAKVVAAIIEAHGYDMALSIAIELEAACDKHFEAQAAKATTL